mmetsp:Transcript_91350/g.263659  ORF Transcript_91350/g.263659 Transcript_91350/m.263659 type:complete len:529 (+) Transcript_91350:1056-2642(+)
MQLAVHVRGSIHVADGGEALDERGVHHRVRWHAVLPQLHQRHRLFDATGATEGVEHAAQRDGGGRHRALLHHLGPQLPATLVLPQEAERLDQEAICLDGWPDPGRAAELPGDRGQALGVPAADASVEHAVEDNLVLAHGHAGGAVQHGQGQGGVVLVARPLRCLHHDGDGVMVHSDTLLVHLAEDGVRLLAASGIHGGAQDGVVRGAVRGHARGGHLVQDPPSAGAVAGGAIAFDDGVVRHAIRQTSADHLLQELRRALQCARRRACIKGGVVHSDVEAGAGGGLGPPEQLHGLVRVAVAGGAADAPNVGLGVRARSLRVQPIGDLRAPDARRELRKAAVHHLVRFDAVGGDVLVQVASLAVEAVRRVDLHQGLVRRQGHHRPAAEVGGDLLREVDVARLAAARHEASAQALAGVEAALLQVLEQLRCAAGIRLREDLQQWLEDGERHRSVLLQGQTLEQRGAFVVLRAQALSKLSGDGIHGHRRELAQADDCVFEGRAPCPMCRLEQLGKRPVRHLEALVAHLPHAV